MNELVELNATGCYQIYFSHNVLILSIWTYAQHLNDVSLPKNFLRGAACISQWLP